MSKSDFRDLKFQFNYPLLTIAVAFEDLESIKFLIEEQKVDVNEVGTNKETALIRACHFNRIEIIRYLLNNGADVEMRTR